MESKQEVSLALQQQLHGQFFFLHNITQRLTSSFGHIELEHQVCQLKGPNFTESERSGAMDKCLEGITCLSNNIRDASSHLPARDQRIYSDVRHFPPDSLLLLTF